MKTRIPSVLITLALICFAVVQKTQAVVPAPDGGYPGFNTAEGQNALFNLTTGVGNAAVGWYSLFSNIDGSFNTAVGAGTLVLNERMRSSVLVYRTPTSGANCDGLSRIHSMTIVEIRPHHWGWKAFEIPGVNA